MKKTRTDAPVSAAPAAIASPPAMAPDGGHYRRNADGSLTCLDPATAPASAKASQRAQDAHAPDSASDASPTPPTARESAPEATTNRTAPDSED